VEEIFERKTKLEDPPAKRDIKISMSFIEIYNEKVYDLLIPKDHDLPIREDANRNIFVSNLAMVS